MQYGYPHLADKLPEMLSENLVDETNEMDVTATGRFQPPIPGPSQAGPSQIHVVVNVEMAVEVPPDDSVTSDSLILSGGATPLRDEPSAEITQMEAATIESEHNDLPCMGQQSSPSSEMATPGLNSEPPAKETSENPQDDQSVESKNLLNINEKRPFKTCQKRILKN